MNPFDLVLAQREGSFWFPPAASTFAEETDSFFMQILYISTFFFVIVVAAGIYCVMKYRRRPGYRGDSTALHNNALEIFWTVVPTIVVCWIFARGVYGYIDMMTPPEGDKVEINVNALQWAWSFEYENGAKSDELHVPVGQPVRLIMRSTDVLHSFYVPAFRAKTDIVPGRVNVMWFKPILEGEYTLFCTEYCGDKHSEMLAKVVVHDQKGYDKWLAEAAKPPETPVAHGKWLYERVGCKACHAYEADKGVIIGPNFAGTYGTEFTSTTGKQITVDEEYIRESILKPQAEMRKEFAAASQMPSFQGKLKENEITALTAFIKALEDGELTDDELNAAAPGEGEAEDGTVSEASDGEAAKTTPPAEAADKAAPEAPAEKTDEASEGEAAKEKAEVNEAEDNK